MTHAHTHATCKRRFSFHFFDVFTISKRAHCVTRHSVVNRTFSCCTHSATYYFRPGPRAHGGASRAVTAVTEAAATRAARRSRPYTHCGIDTARHEWQRQWRARVNPAFRTPARFRGRPAVSYYQVIHTERPGLSSSSRYRER